MKEHEFAEFDKTKHTVQKQKQLPVNVKIQQNDGESKKMLLKSKRIPWIDATRYNFSLRKFESFVA